MRYAIISDVHANLEALKAVSEKLREEDFDSLLFLGDSIGYGPNPNECIEALREEATVLIAGNHDWASIGLTDIAYFNSHARTAIEWTTGVLSDENRAFLKKLPIAKSLKHNNIYIAHSTPKEPEQWHYLLTSRDAYINFQFFTERICLIGHSHQPFIVEQNPEGEVSVYEDSVHFKEGYRYIVNAGSVGQPRDGNPQASYALLHENFIEIKRVSYDIVLTQKKMRGAGLPSALINRLSRGI